MLKQVLEHIIQVNIETRGCNMNEILLDILKEDEIIECDICGDLHDVDCIPWGCLTGDGS